jgi:hypothetical protein
MSHTLTAQGRERVAEIAGRYGVSVDAALVLFSALLNSGGRMAQFNHPELGGGGQWMQGGMTMVGDMFNHGLKAKVDGLCLELSNLLPTSPQYQAGNFQMQSQGGGGYQPIASGGIFTTDSSSDGAWWPDFGVPNWRGGQNDMRYAYYATARRLVVAIGGAVTVYDTGDHYLQGVSQQQQNGGGTLAFTSQNGLVTLASLRRITDAVEPLAPQPSMPQTVNASPEGFPSADDLAGTHWVHASSAAPLTLIADGSIGGDRQKAAFWSVEQGALRLYAEDGRMAAKFDVATRDEAGRVVTLFLSADPTEVLTLAVAATHAQPSAQGRLVLSIELTQGAWDLEAAGTSLGRLRLLDDGRVEGGRPLEARWRSDGTSLSLLHGSGRPTARFDSFIFRDGRWSLGGIFIGEDNAECTLKQV